MIDKEWLDALKPGDEVAVRSGRGVFIARIERRTNTQIVISNAYRFRASDGRMVGAAAWDGQDIEPVTQLIRDKVEHTRLKHRMHSVQWARQDLTTLRAVDALLKGSGHE